MGADGYGGYLTRVDPQRALFYGDGYITDSIIAAVKRDRNDELYRSYVTDALKAITENTAQGGGVVMTGRYYDIVNVKPVAEQAPQKTSEEVKESIINEFKRLGGG